jgi:DNA recombination-dependent growth factor C
MKLIKGARTMRRYCVDGKPDQADADWLTQIQNQFQMNAFENAENNHRTEEQIGWVTGDSLLDADFSRIDKWYLEPYIFGQFRVDKKTLPSNLFRAMFELRVQEWLVTKNLERIPKRDKDDIRDVLSAELYAKTLPKVKVVEFCWNIEQQYLILLNLSDSFNDKFCEHFYTTFGLGLRVQTPLMFLNADDPNLETMTKCGVSGFKAHGI